MREQYWAFYCSIKYKSFYYEYFQLLFNKINWGITALCTLTTLSCVAAWDIWQKFPGLWAVLIGISQVVQALFPRLPYNDLLVSTKFAISAIDNLLLDIEEDWIFIDVHELSDEDIAKRLTGHKRQYSKLVEQFFAGTYLPELKYCTKKAEQSCKNFFSITYHFN